MRPETTNIMGGNPQFNKTETAILGYLARNMTKEFSIKAISDGIKKAYPVVHRNIRALEKKGIVKIKTINPTQTLCSIDTSKPDNIGVMTTVEINERDSFFALNPQIKATIEDVLKRIEGNSFSLLLFGSHVRGSVKPDSDIDLLFLVATITEEGRMLGAAEGAGRLTSRKIHPVVLTYKDFFDALNKREQSLSNEVLEKHIIVYGAEAFYRGLVMNESAS